MTEEVDTSTKPNLGQRIKGMGPKILNSFNRFPIVYVLAYLSIIVTLVLTNLDWQGFNGEEVEGIAKVWTYMYVFLGFSVSLALALDVTAERLIKLSPTQKVYGYLGIFGFSLLSTFYWVGGLINGETSAAHITRFIIFSTIVATLFLYLPYLRKATNGEYWYFIRGVIKSGLGSVVLSLLLFAGIAGIFGSISGLLGLGISEAWYLNAWTIIGGFFGTTLFLALFPKELDKKRPDMTYSSWTKIAAIYVLVPISVIFNIIIYIYTVLVLFGVRELDNATLATISSYLIVDLLLTILLLPLRELKEYGWLKIFVKIYYASDIPLLILYFIAAFQLIGEEGANLGSTSLIVFGITAALILGYVVISKHPKLSYEFAAYAVVFGLAYLLPVLNVATIVQNIEVSRFEEEYEGTFMDNGMLIDVEEEGYVDCDDEHEYAAFRSDLRVLNTSYPNEVGKFFTDEQKDEINWDDEDFLTFFYYRNEDDLKAYLFGDECLEGRDTSTYRFNEPRNENRYFYLSASDSNNSVRGFDYIKQFDYVGENIQFRDLESEEFSTVYVNLSSGTFDNEIYVLGDFDQLAKYDLDTVLETLDFEELNSYDDIPKSLEEVEIAAESFTILVRFDTLELNVEFDDEDEVESIEITDMSGSVLLREE